MSTIMTKLPTYHVSMFTDKSESMVLSSDRLVVVRWKQTEEMTKSKKVAPSAVCVPVPMLAISVEPECLATALLAACQDMQDRVVRRYIESCIFNQAGLNMATLVVPSELVTANGIAAFQAEEAISKRLSKDGIGSWFDRCLRESLEMAFASKVDNDELLARAVNQHREILCKLASPKDRLPEGIAKQMLKALGLVTENDMMKSALVSKLDAFIKPDNLELLIGMMD